MCKAAMFTSLSFAASGMALLCAMAQVCHADDVAKAPCRSDAMIVFDASGSMAGTDFNSPPTPRIERVRKALEDVLPAVSAQRNLGLIDYGPGPYDRCDNISLQLRPAPNAAPAIVGIVRALVPAGRTPLTDAVRMAAQTLDGSAKTGEIVLITDGEETCGGDPCALARSLHGAAAHLTIHVIGYRTRDVTEGSGYLKARCLADETGGTYSSAETSQDLVAALRRALTCPEVSSLQSHGSLPATQRSTRAAER
jgi:Ca-activated chloride channel family protein